MVVSIPQDKIQISSSYREPRGVVCQPAVNERERGPRITAALYEHWGRVGFRWSEIRSTKLPRRSSPDMVGDSRWAEYASPVSGWFAITP